MNIAQQLQLLLASHVSEKTTAFPDQYAFKVQLTANKRDIKAAVEALFNVKVKSVRVLMNKGKVKRFKQIKGRRRSWKKAYVTLLPGSEIDLVTNE